MSIELITVVADINKIVIPSVGLLGIISSSVALVITLLQIRLKTIEQTTTLKNQNIESEIKLIKIFTEIMEIAHAYGETEISTELIDYIIGKIKI